MENKLLDKFKAEVAKSRRRLLTIRKNQLSLWIGRLVISFNDLEYRLAQAITKEIGSDDLELSHMLLASMSYRQKVDFLSALLLKRFRDNTTQKAHIRSVISALGCAEGYRNTVLHSVWAAPIFTGIDYETKKSKTRGGKGLRIDRKAANISALKTAVKDVYALHGLGIVSAALSNLASAVGEEVFDNIAERFRNA